MSYRIPFAYVVAPANRAEFEAVYGPDGDWARFFRGDAAYVGTTLERTAEGEYLVTDQWRARADYDAFLERNAAEYARRSKRHAGLYVSERRLPPT
jgi:hypothetical protein